MDALELSALAAWSSAVSAAGGLVGLVLGNLRLPLVVSGLAMLAQAIVG